MLCITSIRNRPCGKFLTVLRGTSVRSLTSCHDAFYRGMITSEGMLLTGMGIILLPSRLCWKPPLKVMLMPYSGYSTPAGLKLKVMDPSRAESCFYDHVRPAMLGWPHPVQGGGELRCSLGDGSQHASTCAVPLCMFHHPFRRSTVVLILSFRYFLSVLIH